MTKNSDFSREVQNLKERETKLEKFSDLLERMDDLDEKTKVLWKEIYFNALSDRQYAFLLYVDLYQKVIGSTEAHGLHGKDLAKYLERMCRSNDQLLRLSELIEKSEREKMNEDPHSIFNAIADED